MSLGTVALVLRLALAAVFALAAATKLGRRTQTESTLASFGVPTTFRPTVAVLLPLAELAIAVALLPAASSPYAAVAATLMLAAFTFAVARVLRRGEQVDCNCFGSLGEGLVSRWTLVRDLVLMVPAAFVVATGWSDPGPSAVAWVRIGSSASGFNDRASRAWRYACSGRKSASARCAASFERCANHGVSTESAIATATTTGSCASESADRSVSWCAVPCSSALATITCSGV